MCHKGFEDGSGSYKVISEVGIVVAALTNNSAIVMTWGTSESYGDYSIMTIMRKR